jgi:hypothetical protein
MDYSTRDVKREGRMAIPIVLILAVYIMVLWYVF